MGESVSEWWKPTVPKHIVFGNGAVYRTRLFTNAPTTSGFRMRPINGDALLLIKYFDVSSR